MVYVSIHLRIGTVIEQGMLFSHLNPNAAQLTLNSYSHRPTSIALVHVCQGLIDTPRARFPYWRWLFTSNKRFVYINLLIVVL